MIRRDPRAFGRKAQLAHHDRIVARRVAVSCLIAAAIALAFALNVESAGGAVLLVMLAVALLLTGMAAAVDNPNR
jgi:hypothetical protein